MLQNYLKFQNRNVQTFGFVYHDTSGQNHGPVWKIQSFLLNEICMVILWQDCYGKGHLRKSCLFVHREKGLFLSVYVDDKKIGWKETKTLIRCGKYSIKKLIWEKPTSFLGHENLGCTQRQCEISKDIVDNYRTTFESRISAGATEKLPCPENIRISSWSYDMEGHAKKCVERYCELANRTTQQLYKVSSPCIDDHHFKEEELKSVGELSKICSEIVPKCLYLARIGRPDIPWSVNKLARSITKWTKACDKRLSRFISYIHHTCDYKQYCPCGKHGKTMHIGTVSRTPILQEILRIQSLHQVEHCAFSEAIRLFKSVWMCKKQTSVSYSSTESEIMSFEFRMKDGRYTRAWFMGSDRRSSSRKHVSEWSSTVRPE